MIVLNIGGHGDLGPEARGAISALLGGAVDFREFGAWDVGTPCTSEELRDSVAGMIREFPITQREWLDDPPILVLPGYSPSVAMLLALLHGASGFPRTLVMNRDGDGKYVRPMLVDLASARDWGRRELRSGS